MSRILVQPGDLSDFLRLKNEEEVDVAYKAVCTFSSLLNYLKVGDSISVSGITYYKSSETSLEILNSLDKKALIELLSSYGE